jgi:sugar lactone lactonase YvrE
MSVIVNGLTASNIVIAGLSAVVSSSDGSQGFVRLTGQWYGGDAANAGHEDGAASVARFYGINGMCVGTDGYLYVSEFGPENQPFADEVPVDQRGVVIRRIDRETGYTTTVAGLAGNEGFVDGSGSSARFRGLVALYPYDDGILIADYGNDALRHMTYAGVVTTIKTGLSGCNGVCADSSGNIYVAEYDTGNIKKIATDGPRTVSMIGYLPSVANVICKDDNTLIAIGFAGSTIQIIDLSDNSVVAVTGDSVDIVNKNGIAISADYLYFVSAGPGSGNDMVYRMSLTAPWTCASIAGNPNQHSDPEVDLYGLACVTTDSTHLYIGEFFGCRVLKQEL